MNALQLTFVLLSIVVTLYGLYKIVELIVVYTSKEPEDNGCAHDWELLEKSKAKGSYSSDVGNEEYEYVVLVYKCLNCGKIEKVVLK